MVQVLPSTPTFGSQVINELSRAGQGIYNAKLERKNAISLNRPKAQKALYSLFKQYKDDPAYSIDQRQKAEQLAQTYVDSGYDPYQAAAAAREDMLAGFPDRNSKKGKQQPSGEPQQSEVAPQEKTVLQSLSEMFQAPLSDAVTPLNKFTQSPIAYLTQSPIEKIQQAISKKNQELVERNNKQLEGEKGKSTKITKPIDNLSYKEILELPAEAVTSLPMQDQLKIGKKLAEGAKLASDFAFTKGLDPTGLVQRSEQALAEKGASPIPAPTEATSAPLAVSEGIGTLLKDLGLFGIVSKAATVPGKIAASAGLFGGEKAVKTAVTEGRSPTVKEVAESAAFGAAGEALGPTIKAAMNFVKKIPSAYNSIKSVVSGTKGAVTEKKIVEEAVKNLEERGVSILKAAEGDTAALNEIQKESKKVADTFSQADKYNRKELEKIRGEKAEKLVQSPLEEYYEPKKEVKHRPETIAKEAERIKPLQSVISQNERRLRNTQYEILSAQNRLREAGDTLTSAEKSRVEALIDSSRLTHQKALNEIRSAEFEVKYGHPPKTTREINEQIEKSFAEIREGIKDPTSPKVQKLKASLEKGEEGLRAAERLVARGELPGSPVFDEFIKIKKEYIKAYGDLIEELKLFVKDNKGIKEAASSVENAKSIQKIIEDARQHAEASIVRQTDKRKAMKILEGPSGAMWKNLLKDVRTDVEAFKKQWAKANMILSKGEAKTAEASSRALKQSKTEAKPLRVAQEIKAEKVIEKEGSSLKDHISSFGRRFKSGKATEADVGKVSGYIERYMGKLASIPGGLLRGSVIGALQAILFEEFDEKFPAGVIAATLPGKGFARGAAGFAAQKVNHLVSDLYTNHEVKKLKKLRNTSQFNEYRKELESRYSQARVNKILKQVGQS